jgi:putative hydrolase of the HAD superfamily
MVLDPSRFAQAVASAAPLLDGPEDQPYDAEHFVRYTRHIIEQMGGAGESLDACARHMYEEWAHCHHFELYDEVPAVLGSLASAGVRIGLVSNSHRSLESFKEHFDLRGVIAGGVSSSEHGLMKPHPSIFHEALRLVGVTVSQARDVIMVGDSVRQDVEGALRAGLRAALIHRGDGLHPHEEAMARSGVPVIRSLSELASHL